MFVSNKNKQHVVRGHWVAAMFIVAFAFALGFGIWRHAEAGSKFVRGVFEQGVGAGTQTVNLPTSVIAVAFTWERGGGVPSGSLRVKDRGQWDAWEPIPVDEDAASGPSGRAGSQPRFGRVITTVQYRLVPNSARDVRFVALDGRDHRPFLTRAAKSARTLASRIAPGAFAQTTPSVISRTDWGADESLRMKSDGTPVWPLQYAPVTTFIVHHTAGSDGTPDLPTAEAVVRGIYQYHAVAKQWGDIGYNYLIDTAGNIFEGRYGGEGVVAGHTMREACPSKGPDASFNVGTVGIALLGNYETSSPTPAANTALANLIGWKAHDFGIDPTAAAFLVDVAYPTVIGHRDVDCTLCPGANEYAVLPTLRTDAKTFTDALPPLPVPVRTATVIGQSDTVVTVKAGDAATVWVDMRNDSNVPWRSYVADRPQLLLTDAPGSSLQHPSWPSATVVGNLITPNVAPGATGRFTVTLTAPSNAVETVGHFALTWGGSRLTGTDFTATVHSTGLPYEGMVTNSNIPSTVFAGGRRQITLFYQNLGVNGWDPADVRFAVTSATGTTNAFRATSWPKNSRFTLPQAVAPNATVPISIPIAIPKTLGTRTWAVWLERADGSVVPGSRSQYVTRIDSPYQVQLQSETVPVALRVGWRKRVSLTFRNTGITTWGSDTVLVVREAGKASAFRDRTWASPLGRFPLPVRKVVRGNTVTFTLLLRTPKQTGVHHLEFALVSRTDPARVYQSSVFLPIRVDP